MHSEQQRQRDRLHTVLNVCTTALGTAKAIRDTDGIIIDFEYEWHNKAALEHTHCDAMGMRRPKRFSNGDGNSLFEAMVKTVEEDVSTELETHHYAGGSEFWLLYRNVKFGDGLLISFNDITERKLREVKHAYLLSLSDALRPLANPAAIQQTAMQAIGAEFNVHRAFYSNMQDDDDTLVVGAGYANTLSMQEGTLQLSTLGFDLYDHYMEGSTVIINDVKTDPNISEHTRAALKAIQVQAAICIPLVKNGKLRALVTVHYAVPRKWTTSEIALFEETAQRSWICVERANEEERLREGEANLSALFMAMPAGVALIDIDGRVIISNNEMKRFLPSGLIPSSDEERSWRWRGFYPDGSILEIQDYPFKKAIKGESGAPVEFLYTQDNDTELWTRVNYLPIHDSESKVTRIVCVITDINELKNKEAACRKKEALLVAELKDLQLLQKISNRVIKAEDATYLYEALITAAIEIMHADFASIQTLDPQTEHLLLHASKGFDPGLAEHREFSTPGTATSGHAFQQATRIMIPDIGQFPNLTETDLEKYHRAGIVAMQSTPLISREGTCIGIISTYWKQSYEPSERESGLLDVLARQAAALIEARQAEEKLRRSEERFRTLADTVPQIVWTNDGKGAADWFNKRWYEYTGLSYEESQGPGWQNVVHSDDATSSIELWLNNLQAGKMFDTEYRLRGADGHYRWFIGRNVPVHDLSGKVTGWFGTATDIEELKRLQQQKEDFIGIASHELKTPVTSIKIYTEALLEQFRNENISAKASLMQKLDLQVDRLTTLIKDLLDTTKITAGELAMHAEEFNPEELIKQRIEELERISSIHRILFTSAGTPTVVADRERIGQVITNLVSNAIKYSPQGGDVTIKLEATAHGIEISVEDHGIGIPADVKEKVFERFFRVNRPNVQTFPGLGLGLYISAGIVHQHGGTISVQSEEGKGSVFSFSIPYHHHDS